MLICLAGMVAALCMPVRLEGRAAADLSAGSAELLLRYLIFQKRFNFRLFVLAPPELTVLYALPDGTLKPIGKKRGKKKSQDNRLWKAILDAANPQKLQLCAKVGCGDAALSIFAAGALQIAGQTAQLLLLPPRAQKAARVSVRPVFDENGLEICLDGIISAHPAQIILAYLRHKER